MLKGGVVRVVIDVEDIPNDGRKPPGSLIVVEVDDSVVDNALAFN